MLEPVADAVTAHADRIGVRAVQWNERGPHTPSPDEDWIGGPMTEDDAYTAQSSSVVIGDVSERSGRIGGLFLDGWSETLPAWTHEASVIVDVDAPPARAPQTAILGVRDSAGGTWTPRDVVTLVSQVMDAAQVRTLGPADWPQTDEAADPAGGLGASLPLLMVEQEVTAAAAGFCDALPEPDL